MSPRTVRRRSSGESNVTSGATGETMLSGCFLTSCEKQTELNSFESEPPTGIDSGAARSVVPAGKIPGYPVVTDSETGRVHTSATGEHVIDQGQKEIQMRVRPLDRKVLDVMNLMRVTLGTFSTCVGHRKAGDSLVSRRQLCWSPTRRWKTCKKQST